MSAKKVQPKVGQPIVITKNGQRYAAQITLVHDKVKANDVQVINAITWLGGRWLEAREVPYKDGATHELGFAWDRP
jgi:hypothetical protein